jgi:hypothetical protein
LQKTQQLVAAAAAAAVSAAASSAMNRQQPWDTLELQLDVVETTVPFFKSPRFFVAGECGNEQIPLTGGVFVAVVSVEGCATWVVQDFAAQQQQRRQVRLSSRLQIHTLYQMCDIKGCL